MWADVNPAPLAWARWGIFGDADDPAGAETRLASGSKVKKVIVSEFCLNSIDSEYCFIVNEMKNYALSMSKVSDIFTEITVPDHIFRKFISMFPN